MVKKTSAPATKQDIKLLKQDTKLLKQDINLLKQDTKLLKQDINLLKQDTKLLKQQTDALDRKIDALDGKIDTRFLEALVEFKAYIGTLQRDFVGAMNDQASSFQDKTSDHEVRITRIEHRLEAAGVGA